MDGAPVRLWRMEKSTSNSKCKGEMRGSLHCAMDGETVHCFGRDDDPFGVGGREQTTAKTEADPYGMTNKRTTARAKTMAEWLGESGRIVEDLISCRLV
jgi:hypothetical protein